ncbi:MAG: hypothetical protein CVV24_09635 [Ignavibacteriae bacterium HGW-Ignavibacteriae-3]|nr:MAG: hypothetical protein CVV24_09635 [Ignavibacteriae bacterium HGW-Ignavibacteriae-3]
MMRLIKLTRNFLLGFLVLTIAVGCTASSNSQRYKKEKDGKAAASPKIPLIEPAKKNDSKTDKIVLTDPANLTDAEDEFDEPPPIESSIDKTNLISKIDKMSDFNIALTPREKILLQVIKFLDTPYKYGGNGADGIDCSAFTLQVYQNSISVDLPRSAREQYSTGEKIGKDELQFGDLVFFNTTRRSNPGHVGIYLGENKFVHASRTLGVTVSSLDEGYYKKRYVGARRVDQTDEFR